MSKIQVELQEWMGDDAAIANAAWTSTYDKERREGKYDDPEKVTDLVRRCVRDGHAVPLESVVMRFWLRIPVFVDRQHMTHRIASHNGLSGRYRTLPSDFMDVPDDVQAICTRANGHYTSATKQEFNHACRRAYDLYAGELESLKEARDKKTIDDQEYKRAREFLRAVLPTAFMVERTTVMNLRSFANYQRLRNSPHAQPEICEVAQRMLAKVVDAKVAPVALGALMDNGWLTDKANHDWLAWEWS